MATPIAYKIGCGISLVRKKDKLPFKTIEESYSLEYGTNTIEIHEDSIEKGDKVLIVDDLIATGGTVKAAINLVEKLGGEVVECAFVIELPDLHGREKLKGYTISFNENKNTTRGNMNLKVDFSTQEQ